MPPPTTTRTSVAMADAAVEPPPPRNENAAAGAANANAAGGGGQGRPAAAAAGGPGAAVPPAPPTPSAMTRFRSVLLTILSFALTGLVVGNAFFQRQQFYPSVVYITKSNPRYERSKNWIGLSKSDYNNLYSLPVAWR